PRGKSSCGAGCLPRTHVIPNKNSPLGAELNLGYFICNFCRIVTELNNDGDRRTALCSTRSRHRKTSPHYYQPWHRHARLGAQLGVDDLRPQAQGRKQLFDVGLSMTVTAMQLQAIVHTIAVSDRVLK